MKSKKKQVQKVLTDHFAELAWCDKVMPVFFTDTFDMEFTRAEAREIVRVAKQNPRYPTSKISLCFDPLWRDQKDRMVSLHMNLGLLSNMGVDQKAEFRKQSLNIMKSIKKDAKAI